MGAGDEGFSLIELLIVAAIIVVLSAIAVPSFLSSRIAANQASAVGSLRTIVTSEAGYASTFTTGYSNDLASLGPPANASAPPTPSAGGFVDSLLASGIRTGYSFVYSASSDGSGHNTGYVVNANPQEVGRSGTLYFFTDESGVIRHNSSTPAGASDSPIPQ